MPPAWPVAWATAVQATDAALPALAIVARPASAIADSVIVAPPALAIVALANVALAIAVFAAPFASEHPDGLEWVGGRLGILPASAAARTFPAPLADYQVPGLHHHVRLATALAGLAGTVVVFTLGIALARVFTRGAPEGLAPDAA